MSRTMRKMQNAEMMTGVRMLSNFGNFLRMLEALVTGPRTSHWISARRISAKPRVAMAR